MKLDDAPVNQRPNLHHTHDDFDVGEHQHDIVDHYGRTFEAIDHRHDEDGNVTVGEARYKPPKQTFT